MVVFFTTAPPRVAVVVVATAGLAACGSSARGADRTEWRTRADAICAAWDRDVHRLGTATTWAQVATLARRSSELARRHLERLRKLRPPKDEVREVGRMLSALQSSTAALEALAHAAATGDQAATDRAARAVQNAAAAADVHVARLGLRECLSSDG
jgi:hypothetical protein